MAVTSVMLIGPLRRSEFEQARRWLPGATIVLRADDVAAARRMIAAGFEPDLIVLAQSYSGQFRVKEIDRLRRDAPLARILNLLGAWCEGELRSGQPLPAATRVAWHAWQPRYDADADRMARDRCPTWGLPVTATDDEQLLAAPQREKPRRGLVVVDATDDDTAEWLIACCVHRGYGAVWLSADRAHAQVAGASAALLCAAHWDRHAADRLRALAARLSGAPILVLLDFPRVEHHRAAIAAGAAAVLAKPLKLDDLWWHLEHAIGGAAESARTSGADAA